MDWSGVHMDYRGYSKVLPGGYHTPCSNCTGWRSLHTYRSRGWWNRNPKPDVGRGGPTRAKIFFWLMYYLMLLSQNRQKDGSRTCLMKSLVDITDIWQLMIKLHTGNRISWCSSHSYDSDFTSPPPKKKNRPASAWVIIRWATWLSIVVTCNLLVPGFFYLHIIYLLFIYKLP